MSKRKASDNELRYGLDVHSGELRNVKDVPNGKDCDCICPGCKRPLEACHPKEKFGIKPYFRHCKDGEAEGTSECSNPEGARETIIHLLTKDVLLKLSSFFLPEKFVGETEYKGHLMKGYKVLPSVEWFVTNGRAEDRSVNKSFIPDVIFDTPKGPLIIEVLKSHKVDEIKRSKIANAGMYAVELNVKDMEPENIGITPISQRLYDQQLCKWISYPLSDEEKLNIEVWQSEEAKRIDELVVEEQKRKDREERQRLADEQHRLFLIEQAKIIEERRRQQELLRQQKEEAEEKERWKEYYRTIIRGYFKNAGGVYDLKSSESSVQKKIMAAFNALHSELDSAYPDAATLEYGQRLYDEVKKQVIDRKVFIKNKRLESAASTYLSENTDEDFDELIVRDWRGDTIEIPGRSDYWVAYLKEEIPEKIKKFLQNEADRLGLVKARDDKWPYKKLPNTRL